MSEPLTNKNTSLASTPLPLSPEDDDMITSDEREETLLWMSLALDGLLDEADEERLHLRLAADASLNEMWRAWQKVDLMLTQAPSAEPAPGFVLRFEENLVLRERSARRRRQALFALAATVAWLGSAVLIGLLGWALLSNHSQWMNDFVRELVFYPSAAAVWVRAVRTSFTVFVGEPQSVAIGASYAGAVTVLLYAWLLVLRRTTRQEVVSS